MKHRSAIVFVVVALFGADALALNSAPTLHSAYEEARQANSPRASFYRRLMQATGYVRMVNSNPVQEQKSQNGQPGLSFTEFEQTGCSAVYLKPYFLTSAVCFSDSEGRLDPYRRYAHVTIEGQTFNIDPVSIVIHPDFRKNASENDLAVFSVEKSREAELAKIAVSVELLPQSSWISEGQLVTVIGSGATRDQAESSKLDFGVAHAKDFFQTYPDPTDAMRANGALSLSAEEHLLTFRTRNGKNGVNCMQDSGGGVFVELSPGSGEETKIFLQAITIGKVDGAGNPEVNCQDTNRYLVGVDLRYYGDFVNAAGTEIARRRAEAEQMIQAYQKGLASLYGSQTVYGLFLPVLAQELEHNLYRLYPDEHQHERNKRIYAYMQTEAKRLAAREQLASSSVKPVSLAKIWTKLDIPADPWLPVGNWLSLSRKSDTGKQVVFTNKDGTKQVTKVRIRNIGSGRVSFSKIQLYGAYETKTPLTKATELASGGFVDAIVTHEIPAQGWKYPEWTMPVETVTLVDFKGEPKLRIDALPATESQVARKESALHQIEANRQRQVQYELQIETARLKAQQENDEFVSGQAPGNSSGRGVPVYLINNGRRNLTVYIEYIPVGKRNWVEKTVTVPPTGGKKYGPVVYTEHNLYTDADGWTRKQTSKLTPDDRWYEIDF